MRCPYCNHEIEENAKFCEYCGGRLNSNPIPVNRGNANPTGALVTEGIGLLFGILAWNMSAAAVPVALFFMGLGEILMVASLFSFRRFKKENVLYGLGYFGYIISCIAVIVLAIFTVVMLFAWGSSVMVARSVSRKYNDIYGLILIR